MYTINDRNITQYPAYTRVLNIDNPCRKLLSIKSLPTIVQYVLYLNI